jgi:hypothetical protein
MRIELERSKINGIRQSDILEGSFYPGYFFPLSKSRKGKMHKASPIIMISVCMKGWKNPLDSSFSETMTFPESLSTT